MDMLEKIKTRRSIREYQDRPIPKGDIEKIIDAARFAATARNVQPWKFVAVFNKETLRKIASFSQNGEFIKGAALCIAVFCADTKYYLEDGCSATVNIMLAAASLGIGSCWVAGDKKDYCPQVCSLLKAPVEFKLVSLVSLGYPAQKDSFVLKDKLPVSDLLRWEHF
ncbi:MAG: nitroreductase family protein [Candidatus Omnitrophica bacterium]|jgi:nitroreductase|nr:nitroreductase family protein [Candidatus Omnitrophota bacterium]